jgi:hypothetical protein
MQQVSNYNVLADIEAELNRARSKFPSNEDILPALMEEVGELAQALIQHKHEPHKNKTHVDIYNEAIQTAVMAIRIASEGDPNFPYHPKSGYRGPNWEGYKHEAT